jgi:hypothetical protein
VSLFLIFEIRGVLSIKTCLEGDNLVNLTMHAPWCITGCTSNIFHQSHMQRTSLGGSQALFCSNIKEACVTKEHGSDSKQKHQVEGPIMQAKEWTREFVRWNPMEHTVTKQQSKDVCAGKKIEPRGAWRPPGRSAQAGRPTCKCNQALWGFWWCWPHN